MAGITKCDKAYLEFIEATMDLFDGINEDKWIPLVSESLGLYSLCKFVAYTAADFFSSGDYSLQANQSLGAARLRVLAGPITAFAYCNGVDREVILKLIDDDRTLFRQLRRHTKSLDNNAAPCY